MKPELMLTKSRILIFSLALALTCAAVRVLPGTHSAASPVPSRLSDEEFWKLTTTFSEQDGVFRSDNLLSNELNFQYVIPDLLRNAKPGRIYMGVGPEQNFTYIAAVKPAMALIVDIRHGNFDVHLMYKALFEMSTDRADFVSHLFSRKRPEALRAQSSVREIFDAYLDIEPSEEFFDTTLKAIEDQLKNKHGFELSSGDMEGIEWALGNFYRYGPSINYNSSAAASAPEIVGSTGFGARNRGFGGVTYADLMIADDGNGTYRSYLANEENFAFLKELETNNLLIPVVGDFGGSKAIREIGKYLKSSDAVVTAFYLSNVEQYLSQDRKMGVFLANVATLPLDESSTFIRSGGGRGFGAGFGGRAALGSELGNMLREVRPYIGR